MFRFSIRDVLWLVTIVALCFGWSTDHERLTGRYLPRWSYAPPRKASPSMIYRGLPRDIEVLAAWSRFDSDYRDLIIQEWKSGFVYVNTVTTKEEHVTDKSGNTRLVRQYKATIHRPRTGQVFTHSWTYSENPPLNLNRP